MSSLILYAVEAGEPGDVLYDSKRDDFEQLDYDKKS